LAFRTWHRIVAGDDAGTAEVQGDGRVFQGVSAVFCDDDIEAMRQGYKCINCWENLENAFPEWCSVCGFGCKKFQSETFGRIYKGWTPMGSQIDWDAEAERLDRQEYDRALRSRASKSNIVVPRAFS
jgi:hypothetical protein